MYEKWFGSFLALLCVLFLSSSALHGQPQFVSAKQLMFTQHGIIVNIEGNMFVTNAVVHIGHGVYEINDQYYGSCRLCNWPLSDKGMCTNLNCGSYKSYLEQ